ncbi:efflux RND transporter periplasmic adaptor subunit [Roseomonas sp. NAR14]|uniref:Efflux RND transporter periplasmic adaptor subunit n=1 Tax=Roseomonas acroporae TaxID=2937791 RepID=A0A9X1YAY8_9PROT|nr:efflux RND transporter periplasmic adaptor subunit [Roseomonas acroporae]MCK8783166.1 efflux RND transporter periplasmic adaptor subunit [Roseomonas acroporae]
MFDSPHAAAASAPATATRPRRRPVLAALALLVLAGGGLLAAHQLGLPRGAAPPPAPVPDAAPPALTVTVAPAAPRAMVRDVVGDGSVVAWQELTIGAELGGLRVVEMAVEEGDAVRRGQLLARLDDSVLAAQAAQAEAAQAEAAAALDIARTELARAVELARTQNTPRATLDQRQSVQRQAEARLLAARARRDEAAARLAQTRIVAPTDGIVSRRAALLGSIIGTGQEVARLVRDGRLELEMRVPELDLARVQPGQRVRVTHGEQAIDASVRLVAPVVAAETRLGLVRVALPAGTALRPGMFAQGTIPATIPDAGAAATGGTPPLAVPQGAVVVRDGAPAAFVLPEGTDRVALRRLATGPRRDGFVAVTDGLAPGERVVVAGAGFLADGDRVRLAPPASAD